MRTLRLSLLALFFASTLMLTGCNDELKDLRIQNETQRQRIADLESQIKAQQLEIERLQRQLDAAGQKGGIEVDALQQKIAALEDDLARKKELLAQANAMLLRGGQLPEELSSQLQEFAAANDMVEYDETTGVVKFKSDLLFELGSDKVAAPAMTAVRSFCNILKSPQAQEFDVIIAGHTDDVPIAKPETRAKHPTNWHLSVHRAISVLNVMTATGVTPERLSVRGFGQYRPVAPNKPNDGGNPQNRRVEIYIVPKGV